MSEKISLHTSDGVEIIGDFYAVKDKKASAVILLHMMPADRKSWKGFAEKFREAGLQALAIDLRGHGRSVKQGERILDYKQFSDAEHKASRADVDAALKFFTDRGVLPNRIVVIGASIGANLSLDALARYAEIPAAILLSPGLNYRSIETLPLISKLGSGQSVFIVASRDDSYSAESSEKLATATGEKVKLIIFEDSKKHGTDMFLDHPELMGEMERWIKNVWTKKE